MAFEHLHEYVFQTFVAAYAFDVAAGDEFAVFNDRNFIAQFFRDVQLACVPFDGVDVRACRGRETQRRIAHRRTDLQDALARSGNGSLDAVSNALIAHAKGYSIASYEEHAITQGSNSQAIAYIGIQKENGGPIVWGAGTHTDIIAASINALISALNRLEQ